MNFPVVRMDRARRRSTRILLTLGSLSFLSACASIPAPTIGAGPKSAAHYGVTTVDTTPSTTSDHRAPPSNAQMDTPDVWPAANWWDNMGDPQLGQLITEALADAPDMRAAEARARQAMAAAQFTKGDLLPSLGASASTQMQRQSYNLGFPAPRGWDDNGRISLDFGWDIDFWGKNRAAYSAALSTARAAAAERDHAALALSAAIASHYADLAGLFADRDAAQDAVTVRTRTWELMSQRQQNGLENRGAVERAQSAQAQALGELAATDEAIAVLQYRIAMLMGQGPDRGASITRPTARGRITAALPRELPLQLLGRRPDIMAARLRLDAAQKHIDVAERSFYPNINLAAFIGLSSINLSQLLENNSLIGGAGPALSLPLFQGGKLRAQYRLSEADYDLAVAQYDQILAHALGEVASIAKSMAMLETRLDHARTANQAAENAHRIANDRYRGGLANSLDVLAAEDALIATRRARAALETRALTLDIDLIRALGGGYQNS